MKALRYIHPILVIIVFSIFTSLFHSNAVVDSIKFLLMLAMFVFLPGGTLSVACKNRTTNPLKFLIVSFITGYSLALTIYILFLILGIQRYILIIMVILALLSMFVLFFSSKFKKRMADYFHVREDDEKWFSYILIIMYLLCFITFQSAYLLNGQVLELNQDLMFWLRNSVAATKDYPLPDLSISPHLLYYHYFSPLFNAFVHLTTGIDMFQVCFSYSYVLNLYLLLGCSYLFFSEFIQTKKYVIFCLLFVVFFSGIERISYVFYHVHLYRASFGFTEGYALYILSLYLFLRCYKSKKFDAKFLFCLLLIFALEVGFKGPLASVSLVGFTFGSLLFYIRSRQRMWLYLGGSVLLIYFVILYTFVLDFNLWDRNNSRSIGLSFTDTLFASPITETVYLRLTSSSFASIGFCISSLLTILSSYPSLIIIFVYVLLKIKLSDLAISDYILLIMILCGLILWIFVSQEGLSQMYFYMSIIPIVLFFSFNMIERHFNRFPNRKRIITYALCIGFFCFVLNVSGAIIHGIKHLFEIDRRNYVPGVSLTMNEKIGLDWVKANVPQNAVVITNVVLDKDGNRSYLTSAFSERQVYLEGFSYSNLPSDMSFLNERKKIIQNVLNGDERAICEVKKDGVDYVVIYKNSSIETNMKNCKNSVVFDNSDMTVVKL